MGALPVRASSFGVTHDKGIGQWEEAAAIRHGIIDALKENFCFHPLLLPPRSLHVTQNLGVDPRSVPQDLKGNWLVFYCWYQPELEVESV